LIDPRNGEPIYVGKGCRGRMLQHWSMYVIGSKVMTGRNPKLESKLRKIASEGFESPIYEKWAENEDEDYCLFLESYIIDFIGLENLCNITSGGNTGPAMKGTENPFWGKSHSEETRRKLSELGKGRNHSEESRKKMGESRRGRKHSEETRAKMSRVAKGRKFSPEHIERMRARSYLSKSGYRGVMPNRNSFVAIIGWNGKRIYLGTFPTSTEAAKAYNRKAIELYGDKARLNMIPQ
jgi:hypothetical protein